MGAQLHHHSDAHQTPRDGTGNTKQLHLLLCHVALKTIVSIHQAEIWDESDDKGSTGKSRNEHAQMYIFNMSKNAFFFFLRSMKCFYILPNLVLIKLIYTEFTVNTK